MINLEKAQKEYEFTKRELEIIREKHIIKQKEFHKWVIETKKRYEKQSRKKYDI